MYISFMVISENFSQSSRLVGNFAFPFLISFLGELSELFFFFFFCEYSRDSTSAAAACLFCFFAGVTMARSPRPGQATSTPTEISTIFFFFFKFAELLFCFYLLVWVFLERCGLFSPAV